MGLYNYLKAWNIAKLQSNNIPIVKDLVLIGGGHSHLSVLKYFGMNPIEGLRITLITRDLHTPYSGMLPGYIAGHYTYDESHIDLRPLGLFAKCRIIHNEVEGLDLDNKKIICPNRPAISYDVLSINIGSRPGTLHIPGADEYAMKVKPINHFLNKWETLYNKVKETETPIHITVVGAGAGGVEMALSTQYRLHKELKKLNKPLSLIKHSLICDTKQILPTHNQKVRSEFEAVLKERDITVLTEHQVTQVTENQLECQNQNTISTDAILWVTNASAPHWLKESGLDVDSEGFIQVNDTLESTSHANVFAAGDIASVTKYPRPKSGVFAVRQGPPLARNLEKAISNKKLKPFKPQKEFLGLISTGNQFAIASRGNWSLKGAWLWKIKDKIDRKFMQNFSDLPEMETESAIEISAAMTDANAIKEISAMAMRCGGCGAKVGSTVLSRVMNKLSPISRDDVIIGLDDPDDAAIIEIPAGKLLVQSVDYFRSFIDDPFIFGQVAANHALSDIFAMGAESQSALAVATVPYGLEKQTEETLYQLMSGALKMMNASNTALVGGHSSEGAELSFGLSVNGIIDKQKVLTKSGMQTGDILIVTKPLGTGTLFAADMRLKAKGRWIDSALEQMLLSNQAAGLIMHKYGTTACTDVTGFGLLGHLVEMTRSSGTTVEINLDSLPIMDGALDCIDNGIFSSLQEQNVRLRRAIKDTHNLKDHKHYPMLFDPQTSGGLLATVPAENVSACLDELKQLGYQHTEIIGKVVGNSDSIENITLV